MSEVRLATLLARRGVASRRGSETLIQAGKVTVDGQVVLRPETRVDPDRDTVRVSGRPLPKAPPMIYVLMNKPRGTLVTQATEEGETTVFQLLGRIRWPVQAVGRLDRDTEGVLLLTTDGELAARLTHPKNQVEREYLAKVSGPVDEKTLEKMRQGRTLDDGFIKPRRVSIEARRRGATWIRIVLTEGRNRAVRRYFDSFRHRVLKLRRVRFGPLKVVGMPVGSSRVLQGEEVHRLRAAPDEAKAAAEKLRAREARPRPSSAPPKKTGKPSRKGKIRSRRRRPGHKKGKKGIGWS